jgi:hypothetical protein
VTRLEQIRATYRGAVDGFIQVLLFHMLRFVKLSRADLGRGCHHPATNPRGCARRGGLRATSRVRVLEYGNSEVSEDCDGPWMSRLRAIVPGIARAEIEVVSRMGWTKRLTDCSLRCAEYHIQGPSRVLDGE